jgi:hypothetical protein
LKYSPPQSPLKNQQIQDLTDVINTTATVTEEGIEVVETTTTDNGTTTEVTTEATNGTTTTETTTENTETTNDNE